ncbi:uncharacterized protein MELLADRAFT_93237 [Melampsora larici-populina 98AG31]|uniref:FAD-binding FR-type domain-containing protein n=1 Tax=Melampsora larici-populina (strain 98AG31 / pathotype 3-4-7) TaxID=747676 RepID=F4S4F7_MELLP|nr:uncharacterized protein MELLADRAFT_93237 [Melampsora larici-populina 98AG31]EGG00404.1 hypothetical protein MELLADRAFT_93237 [Melampsora larici-populina 98AG31]
MASASGPPPRIPNFELNERIGAFFAYLGLVGLGAAVLFRLPSFVKHVRGTGKYGYTFLAAQQNGSVASGVARVSQGETGTVMKNSWIKSTWWNVQRALMTRIPLTSGLSVGKLLLMMRFGFLAVSQLPITFALSMKNSPLGYLIGEGYEKLNFLHRFTADFLCTWWLDVSGRLMFLFALVHGALLMKIQVERTGTIHLGHAPPSWGFAALVTMLVMGFTGWRVIRERFYQLFLVIHVIGYIVILVTIWKHVPATHPYVYVSIAFLGVDHVLKALKTRYTDASLSIMPGGLTRIEVHGINEGWHAGNTIWGGFFEVTLLTNVCNLFAIQHPFTIVNAPNRSSLPLLGQDLVLVAKAAGDFTRNMHKMADKPNELLSEKSKTSETFMNYKRFRVTVEGPYGVSFDDPTKYGTVFLCAGGIGITYCIGILEDIVGKIFRGAPISTQKIELVWAFRDSRLLEGFEPALAEIVNVAVAHPQISINIRLFRTGGDRNLNDYTSLPAKFEAGARPDFKNLLDEVAAHPTSLAICVCGPISFVDSVSAAAISMNTGELSDIALHTERFGW